MSNLMTASRQWATRPSDERFLDLNELHAATYESRKLSAAKVLPNRALEVQPDPNDNLNGLVVVGPNGVPATMTNWSFGQLSQRAGAPAGYLRDLPAPLAADCLNYGIRHGRDVEELGILLRKPVKPRTVEGVQAAVSKALDGEQTFAELLKKPMVSPDAGPRPVLAAVTGPNYGRVWNHEVVGALLKNFGDGVTGAFRVPGIFGKALTEVTRENTTLYASDRDMFVFLADESRRIEIPNRRNGEPGSMARGFFVWNSEVGAQTLGIATFLFDYVCMNRIVWGATQYSEIKIRHTSGAPARFIEEVLPAIKRYAAGSDTSIKEAIEKARAARIGDEDKVRDFLSKRYTRTQAGAIMMAHKNEEGRPIESLWDAAVGATAYARGIQYQNERVEIEREAGKILDLAK